MVSEEAVFMGHNNAVLPVRSLAVRIIGACDTAMPRFAPETLCNQPNT